MRRRRRVGRRGWLASCAAAAIVLVAAGPPPKATLETSPPVPVELTGKPLTLLEVALVAAENHAIPRLRREDNLTWQSGQLAAIAQLLARAGRDDEALRLIRGLQTPARVKVPAYTPLAVAALRRGDRAAARAHVERIVEMAEWTSSGALSEVALAMDAAGDHEGAAKLAARIEGARERADTFIALRRYPEAIAAAREIPGDSHHVPCGDRQCWRYFYDGRQGALLSLIETLVDLGDVAQARKTMEAFAEVDDHEAEMWRARALVAISRREDAKSTLRLALDETDEARLEFPGDRVKRAVLLADIAARLAEAGERNLATAQLPKALAAIGPVDSIQTAELDVTLLAEGVSHIARAYFALDRRDEAVELLGRLERLADAWPVPPPPEKREESSWDSTGAAEHARIEAKLRVAAALESAGETERGEKVLASALAETAAMRGAEWREYPWRSLVEIYGEVGRLDRAVAILTSGPSGNADKWLAIFELSEGDLAPSVRAQIWGLLDVLPPGIGKADLAGSLASRFAARGEKANAARLVSEALASLAAAASSADKDQATWPLTLVSIAGTVPDAERPGNEEQQRWLRQLLAAASVKGPDLVLKRPR